MRKSWQVLFRMAARICAALSQRQRELPDLERLTARWDECRASLQRLSRVDPRLRPTGDKLFRTRLQQRLRSLGDLITLSLDTLAEEERHSIPSVPEVALELVTLDEEFETVRIDLRQNLIVVATDDIELDGMNLGPYEIRLDVTRLNKSPSYTIRSLDENQAASDSSVCHPHVSQNRLCEGDGQVAIHAALREGRLLDFFVVVNQILATYNSDSAYVSLDHWGETDCRGCGELVDGDNWSSCENCQDQLCSYCTSACAMCEDYCCTECLSGCSDCGNSYCATCMGNCTKCHDPRCQSCLESNGTCHGCRAALEEENDDETTESQIEEKTSEGSAPGATATEVHTVCVGEAGLDAGYGTDGDRGLRDYSE
jgi:hypothetical protein